MITAATSGGRCSQENRLEHANTDITPDIHVLFREGRIIMYRQTAHNKSRNNDDTDIGGSKKYVRVAASRVSGRITQSLTANHRVSGSDCFASLGPRDRTADMPRMGLFQKQELVTDAIA